MKKIFNPLLESGLDTVSDSISDITGLQTQIDSKINKDGSTPLTNNWDAGSFEIRAQTLQSDVVTGTAPLTIASTTKVTSLNADLLDGLHDTDFAKVTNSITITVGAGKDYATIQGALNSIKTVLKGNVIISIDSGTYNESLTFGGYTSQGSYSVSIKGATTTTDLSTTATGGTAGNATTQSTVIKNLAGWTINGYRGKWIKFTSGANNNKIRAINSNTADTLTLSGAYLPAAPANNDTFIIYSNNVDIIGDNGVLNPTSLEIIFQNINLKGMIINSCSLVRFIECKQSITGYNNHKRSMSTVWHKDSIFEMIADVSGLWMFGGVCTSDRCMYYEDVGGATFTWGFLLQGGAHILSRNGDTYDGFAYSGIWLQIGGTGQSDGTDSYSIEAATNLFVKNNFIGIFAEAGGNFNGISGTVFSGNGTNYNPVGATDPAWLGG